MKNGYDLIGAPWLSVVVRVFRNTPVYLVGGAVRDPLMGQAVHDVDLCGPATPDEVCAICEGTQVRASVRSAAMGCVELFVTDENGREHMGEYTTFRRETYSGGHRPSEVVFVTSPCEDAFRRDFSVNAMYRQLMPDGPGPLIDPAGGMEHLRRGCLHTVTEDPDLIMKNDGLRLLRASRFCSEHSLVPSRQLLASMRRYAYLLRDIAPGQQLPEWQRLLTADGEERSGGTVKGLCILRSAAIFPLGLPWRFNNAAALQRLKGNDRKDPVLRIAILYADTAPETLASAFAENKWPRAESTAVPMLVGLYQRSVSGRLSVTDVVKLSESEKHRLGCMLNAQRQSESLLLFRELAEKAEGLPADPKHLSLSGSEVNTMLKAAGKNSSSTGKLLSDLWRQVVEGSLKDNTDDLKKAVREMICAL